MTFKNIDPFPLAVSALLVGVGIAAVWFSMQYSYTGFSRAFPSIPEVGNLGKIFAMLAFVTVSMVTVFSKRRMFVNAAFAGIVAALCCGIDIMGNLQALDSDSIIDERNYQESNAAYLTAVDALGRQLKEAASIETTRELMASSTPDEIKNAQLYLQALGEYTGRIDGERGELTIRATTAHGSKLAARSEELAIMIASNEAIIAKGAPIVPKDRSIYSYIFAIGLTILGASCSYFGSLLYYIGIGADRKRSAEMEEDELDQQVASALEMELINLRKETGIAFDDTNGLRLVS